MNFNQNISVAMARTMKHLSDLVFVFMANFTLSRRDSYLSHFRSCIKPDTLAALGSSPHHLATLFLDINLKKDEDDIVQYKNNEYSGSSSRVGMRSDKSSHNKSWSGKPAWPHQESFGQDIQLLLPTGQGSVVV